MYELFLGKTKVSDFTFDGDCIRLVNVITPNLLPKQDFTQFIKDRAFCYELAHMRSFAKSEFNTFDQVYASIRNNLLSISDKYWCREKGSNYEPVDTDALYICGSETSLRNPAVCTNGSFSKHWEKRDGQWWLIKSQSFWSTISECLVSSFLVSIDYPTQIARMDTNHTAVRCLNFVKADETFEPYSSYRFAFKDKFDTEDAAFKNLEHLGFRDILFIDALVMNVDRHSRNFGVLRDTYTGEVRRLAPNYDNNLAFLSDGVGQYGNAMLNDFSKRYGLTPEEKEIIKLWRNVSKSLIATRNAR